MTFQFFVSLKDTFPLIWRRISVSSTLTFDDLHLVIQVVMPWENVKKYEFSSIREYGTDCIALLEEAELEDFVHRRKSNLNAETLTLESYFEKEGTKFGYLYDISGQWCHELVLEKIHSSDSVFPKCIEWEGISPLEDCGGVSGYYQFLTAINDPLHPKHLESMVWAGLEIGEKFEEVYPFDMNEVNRMLEEVFEE